MTQIRDKWALGTTYEEFMGRWSRRLAPRFLSWLRVPEDVHWLDVGCGTGPAPTYVASPDGPGRSAVLSRLAEMLPRSADGTLALGARAWGVRGSGQ